MTFSIDAASWPCFTMNWAGFARVCSYASSDTLIWSTHHALPHSQTISKSSVMVANASFTASIRSFTARNMASFSPTRVTRSSVISRVGALVDGSGFAEFLRHHEAFVPLEHPLDLEVLVAGERQPVTAVGP